MLNERSQGLAKAQPVLNYSNSHDERQERMRHLANVFIDMYQAERSKESEALPILARAA